MFTEDKIYIFQYLEDKIAPVSCTSLKGTIPYSSAQIIRLYFRSLLGNPMGPSKISYHIRFLIPHWKSSPPGNSNGVLELQWVSVMVCPIGIPIPHEISNDPMRFPMTLIREAFKM